VSVSKRKYHVLDGLYRDCEAARREYENDPQSEGGLAYGRWLELLEIADWHFEGAPGIEGDPADVEGCSDAEELGGTPALQRGQLELPGMRELDADVPRGTSGQPSERVDLVGATRLKGLRARRDV